MWFPIVTSSCFLVKNTVSNASFNNLCSADKIILQGKILLILVLFSTFSSLHKMLSMKTEMSECHISSLYC